MVLYSMCQRFDSVIKLKQLNIYNYEMQTYRGRWNKITTKTLNLIGLIKVYPILVNIYISALCIEWWLGYDIISKYVYPFIGDSFFVLLILYFASYVFKLCKIYRLWLINMAVWLFFETLTNYGVVINEFLIVLSCSTLVTFFATLYILIQKWKITIAKT